MCMCTKHIGRSQCRRSHMWSHDNVKLNMLNHVATRVVSSVSW